MTRLIIWRHGQTTWNAARRVQGQIDIELSDLGRRQAAEAAERLAALGPTRIVSSDLRRADATAEDSRRGGSASTGCAATSCAECGARISACG